MRHLVFLCSSFAKIEAFIIALSAGSGYAPSIVRETDTFGGIFLKASGKRFISLGEAIQGQRGRDEPM